jgi:single-strand DNA-binding protein
MINRITLLGRVGKDPTQNSTGKTAAFSVATDYNHKDQSGQWVNDADWHRVVCWGYTVETAMKLQKGSLVYVEGRQTQRKYTDRNGQEQTISEVVAAIIKDLTPKPPKSQSAGIPVNEDDIPF